MRTLFLIFLLPSMAAAPPFVFWSDDGQMVSPLEALLDPLL